MCRRRCTIVQNKKYHQIWQEPTETSVVWHVNHNTLVCGTSILSVCYHLGYPEIVIGSSMLNPTSSTLAAPTVSLAVQWTLQQAVLQKQCDNLFVYLEEQWAVTISCRVARRHYIHLFTAGMGNDGWLATHYRQYPLWETCRSGSDNSTTLSTLDFMFNEGMVLTRVTAELHEQNTFRLIIV